MSLEDAKSGDPGFGGPGFIESPERRPSTENFSGRLARVPVEPVEPIEPVQILIMSDLFLTGMQAQREQRTNGLNRFNLSR